MMCATSRHRDAALSLEPYLSEIRGDALLSAAEETALAEAIARGDRDARARLIRANLRLVVKIARQYAGRGLGLDDLVGEGNLGLIRAAQDYDPRFGTRFSTYAAHWIKQAIRQALTNTSATIRLPAHMVGLLARWRRTERSLGRALGRAPHFEEVADALGLSKAQREMVNQAQRSRHLLHEGGTEAGAAWSSDEAPDLREAPERSVEAEEERGAVLRRLDRLDARERTVVALRYGLDGERPLTLKEVGRRLGVTREWVRKIELRAVQKLGDSRAEGPAPRRPARRMALTA
jgi:RNA polymerase primary sigma factor